MPADNSTSLRGKDIVRYISPTNSVWSSTAGALFTDPAATVPYVGGINDHVYLHAQNKTSAGVVKTADDAAIHNIGIMGVFPAVPHFPHEWSPDKRGVVRVVKRDGSVSGKIHGNGQLMRDFKLAGRQRTKDEIAEIEQFFDDHFPFVQFIYEDQWITNHSGIYIFDSKPTFKPQGVQDGEFDCAIMQVG